jgi:hypothetical protein
VWPANGARRAQTACCYTSRATTLMARAPTSSRRRAHPPGRRSIVTRRCVRGRQVGDACPNLSCGRASTMSVRACVSQPVVRRGRAAQRGGALGACVRACVLPGGAAPPHNREARQRWQCGARGCSCVLGRWIRAGRASRRHRCKPAVVPGTGRACLVHARTCLGVIFQCGWKLPCKRRRLCA